MRTKWFHIKEQDFNELLRLSHAYYREAVRCKDSKAYIAGCVMAGASLEALLLMMVNMYGHEVETAHLVPMVKNKPKPLLDWKFKELVNVTRDMKWLPPGLKLGAKWNTRRARIGDYAEVLRQIRNLVHPSRYLQDHSPLRVTKKYLEQSIDILEIASEHLQARVLKSLRKKLGVSS